MYQKGEHKVRGLEEIGPILQRRKQRIDPVILARMSANLRTQAHMRKLAATRFEVANVNKTIMAAKVS